MGVRSNSPDLTNKLYYCNPYSLLSCSCTSFRLVHSLEVASGLLKSFTCLALSLHQALAGTPTSAKPQNAPQLAFYNVTLTILAARVPKSAHVCLLQELHLHQYRQLTGMHLKFVAWRQFLSASICCYNFS